MSFDDLESFCDRPLNSSDRLFEIKNDNYVLQLGHFSYFSATLSTHLVHIREAAKGDLVCGFQRTGRIVASELDISRMPLGYSQTANL